MMTLLLVVQIAFVVCATFGILYLINILSYTPDENREYNMHEEDGDIVITPRGDRE